jgi:hypothetical protein
MEQVLILGARSSHVSSDQVERVSYLLASEGINPTPPNTPSA